MTTLEILEQKIRNVIPELKEEFEAFQEGAIHADMITPVMMNHVLVYMRGEIKIYSIDTSGLFYFFERESGKDFCLKLSWNLKYMYLKDQSEELINFLNELK